MMLNKAKILHPIGLPFGEKNRKEILVTGDSSATSITEVLILCFVEVESKQLYYCMANKLVTDEQTCKGNLGRNVGCITFRNKQTKFPIGLCHCYDQ